MILFGNFLIGVGQALAMVLNIVMIIVVVSCILSCLGIDPYHPVVNYFHSVAERLYSYPRKYFSTVIGRLDFAPFIIIVLCYFLQTVVVASLMEYGYEMKRESLLGVRRQYDMEQSEVVRGKRL
jgi:YggT family protein